MAASAGKAGGLTMDMRLLRLCSNFALHHKRALGEAVSVSEFEAGGRGPAMVMKALRSPDARLASAAKELADALGVEPGIEPVRSVDSMPEPSAFVSKKEPSLEPVEPLSPAAALFKGEPGISAKQWKLIEECAREAAGPIAELWLDQVKEAEPASFKDAVVLTSVKLGSFGKDFASIIRLRIRGSGA